jgi:TPP-dependent pyruvate/acetoin dehydrogenase alpha subunit
VGFGLPGIQVDGNDLFAVYRATKEAVDFARAGNGPVLIEAVTYRMGAHTTSDDPTKYRTSEEEKIWEPRDPLIRVKKYLLDKQLWSDAKETAYEEECAAKIDEVVQHVVGHRPESDSRTLRDINTSTLTNSLDRAKSRSRSVSWLGRRRGDSFDSSAL